MKLEQEYNTNSINHLIRKLLYISVDFEGHRNAVVICDSQTNVLSVGYNKFVYGNTRKFSETLNPNLRYNGDRYYIIDAFTLALINLIKVNKKSKELFIYTTNLPNAQATKILTYFNVKQIVNYNIAPFILFPEITENYDIENDKTKRAILVFAREKKIKILDGNINDDIVLNKSFNLNNFINKTKTIENNNYLELNFDNSFLYNIQKLLELLDNFSDDRYFQVSACLIDKNKRLINCATNMIPPNSAKKEYKLNKLRKRKFILCAEQNLIMDSIFKNISFNNKILIVNAIPCYMCAKMLVEFNIKNILIFNFNKFQKIDFTDEIGEDIFLNANINYKIINKISSGGICL